MDERVIYIIGLGNLLLLLSLLVLWGCRPAQHGSSSRRIEPATKGRELSRAFDRRNILVLICYPTSPAADHLSQAPVAERPSVLPPVRQLGEPSNAAA